MSVAVSQTFAILELLADSPDGLGITDIAVQLEVNKQIPFRHLALLEALGYVKHDKPAEKYLLTFKLGALGLRQIEGAGVENWAQPALNSLAALSGEMVRLAAVSGNQLYWVAMSEGSRSSLRIDSAPGEASLVTTASGRALLSTFEPAEALILIRASHVEALTPLTLTNPEDIASRVAQARSDGYAVVENERELGISSIGVAIPSDDPSRSAAIGTVSIAGPSVRMDSARLQELSRPLRETAIELSHLWPLHRYESSERANRNASSPTI